MLGEEALGVSADINKISSRAEIGVVGIGYSAGGLEPVQEILSAIGKDIGLAFVVIQHLKHDQDSHLCKILEKYTTMPVKPISNRTRLAPNTVFVLPPGQDVALAGGYLHLSKRGESDVPHLGIDLFFSSLSQNRKSKSIGVILSGSGADGTLGLKAIKSEGGITIVQDPKTAKFDGMPRSAIASGVVDLILSPHEIARELIRFAKHPYTCALPEVIPLDLLEPSEGKDRSIFSQILDLLLSHTNIDFSKYKMSTIKRRIERQMMLRKIETVDRYAEYLRKNTDEIKALYEDIFIHVTDFFRDEEAFEAIKKKVFPVIVKEKTKSSPVRMWIPGCATGEEVYSLAILMCEYLEENSLDIPINIFAGDISEPALHLARKGLYADYQMKNVSQGRLDKYFEKIKGGYKVKKSLRDLCIFSRHDVTSNPPIPNVDLISCRNVLIYFSTDLQRRVFPVFHYALNSNGVLWLGKAESPNSNSKLFKAVDKAHKIFAKVGITPLPQHQFSSTTYSSTSPEALIRSTSSGGQGPLSNADQLMLYRYSPPSVVINNNLEVVNFRGRTVPYLEPPSGGAHYELLKMANPDIARSLRHCVQSAKKNGSQFREDGVEFEFEGRKRKVNIDVSPLNMSVPVKERLYLVIFEDATAAKNAASRTRITKKTALKKGDPKQVETLLQHNTQLQQELDAAREYQRSLIEEYETAQEELTSANEELRSTNEELQSTNEELHSANEELGTAKEELQAANEELLSINDELQKRNQDLETALRDLAESEQKFRLMIEGVKDYAIFMLDPGGKITSWNEGAKRMKGYERDEIIGQHFSRFYMEADIQRKHPEHELQIARKVGRYEEENWRIRKDGSRFWANVVITCIRDKDGKLVGYSKVTRDLTERMQYEAALKAANESLEARVESRTAEFKASRAQLADALKLRDEFLSIASHELKTPLTTLKLEAQMTRRALEMGDRRVLNEQRLNQFVTQLDRRVDKLRELVDDMLDVSRIQRGSLTLNPEETDLSKLLHEAVKTYKPEIERAGCEISLNIQDDIVGTVDQSRIEQVVLNLLSNAVKYGAGKPIVVSAYQENNFAIIKVEDHGIGISEENQKRIFERFERAIASNEISGLGLGLYISKQILSLHAGKIDVKSKPGIGSEFMVTLPLNSKHMVEKKDEKTYEF